jgi:hypothetical protein
MVRSIMVVLLVASAFTVGCGRRAANDRAAPESAFGAFREALVMGDAARIATFLTPEDAATLERWAETYVAAGRERPDGASLIRTAWMPWDEDVASIDRVTSDDVGATLRVAFHNGGTADVRLIRVAEGGWMVDLDLPEPGASEGSST